MAMMSAGRCCQMGFESRESEPVRPCCGYGCLLGKQSQTQLQGGVRSLALLRRPAALAGLDNFDVFLGVSVRQRRVRTCRAAGRESKAAKWTEESTEAG